MVSGPSLVASDGFPYVFDSFLLAADPEEVKAALQDEDVLPSRAQLSPVEHENELPLDNTLVDFPSG